MRSATSSNGHVELRVVGEHADHGARVDRPASCEVSVRPLDDDLVGIREARRVANTGRASQTVTGSRGSSPTRATAAAKSIAPNTSIRGAGAKDWHEHGQLVLAPLAVGTVVQRAGRARGRACRARRRRPRRRAGPCPGCRRCGRGHTARCARCRPGPVDHRGDGDRLAVADRGDHLRQLRERRSRRHRLDEDVDDAAAGQPDRERVVVADAVALQHRLAGLATPPGRARRRHPRRSRR